ncbi:hypothetical protein CBR_g17576 [Chara braunii]|uniref:Uncharacterized protein n=1 Tax=Chara braunii TaxID=69332 RepID=A0A388KUX6_CHABU|nr:hypothetical protein CBR_g17576 [Chara braunii]|eukprot:GBG73865.1 hypothetical protein CBR_g17576 [Chara braunii]
MSFLTERALDDHMLAPRGDISTIRQVHHPRFSLGRDLLRLAQFFSTVGVHAAAEFRFAGHHQAIVLVEATTVRRLSAPGVSHVSTVVIVSGEISAIIPLRHTPIRTSLREWGQRLAGEWNQWLTRRDDNLVPVDDIDVGRLRTSQHESTVSDESPVPHVFSQALTPYLQWSTCLEELEGNNNPPSQQPYLDPQGIIDLAFFQPRTASEDEAIALEEEEEEDEEGSEEEEETPEEGSYSEHSEGEQSDDEEEEGDEEEDEEEEEESEWETLGEEADRVEGAEEDPEAVRKREEIAAGKQQLEYASEADLPISNDLAKDPEPPKPEDGDLAAETSSAPAKRRRSRSPSPSTSARPPVRPRTDAGHRASSPVLIPSSP